MSKSNSQSILDVLGEVSHAFLQTARFGLRQFQRLSWPALLLSCIVLALLLTMLPLAVMLFAIFLLLKLAVGACVLEKRRHRRGQEHSQ